MHDARMLARALAALLVLFAAAGAARANDVAAAREHFQRGSTAYDLGRFLDAAHEYESAYEASPDPSMLFNIGQSYRFAREYQKASLSFKAFLRRAPDAPNRAEVEARLVEMQQLMQAEQRWNVKPEAATLASPAPTAPAQAATHATLGGRRLLIAGIVTAAVGVAFMAAGGAFVAQTGAADDAVNHPPPGTPFSRSLVDTLDRDQALEATFLAVGSAAVIAGAAVAIIGGRRLHRERKLAWAPVIQSGAAGAVVAGSW